MRKYRKSLPNTTPEQFCVWLHEWIEAFNLPIQNQWGWSFPLDPPSCIDVVQGEPPYKIVVRRKPTDRRAVVNLWNSQREKEYPRRSETPPYNPVALEITISRVGKGIDVEVDCNDGHRLQLEKFAFALMALETKGQSLAGIVERMQELSKSEPLTTPSALRDAIDMQREKKLLALGLTADGKQPTTTAEGQTEIDGPPEPEVLDQLTDREKEVAVCLAQGLRRLQIANKLVISDNTVKVHFNEIARKWNLTTTKGEILQAEAKRRGYG